MNRNVGLIARKLGCGQFFGGAQERRGVTVVEAGPCVVIGKRTVAKDGYTALRLSWGEKPERKVSRPVRGQYKAAQAAPGRVIKEFRVADDVAEKYAVGQVLGAADLFKKGDLVDITANSRGRGFAGVIKRHKFASWVAGHGTHEYFRHSGSIGQNMTPGRTYPGLKMPGHMGDRRVTIVGMKVAEVDAEQGLVLLDGSVPGARNGLLTVRLSHRKPPKPPPVPAKAAAKKK